MVKNDLIERYVYAVTKYMKADLKKDVSAELETIIPVSYTHLTLPTIYSV